MAEIASTTFSQVDASNTGPLPGLTGATNPNQIDNSIQAMMGAVKREHDWRNYAVTSGGSSNAYTLTYAVAPAAYYTPMRFTFKTSFAVTGAATVNVNTLGAKTIKKLVSGTKTDLASGDIASGDYIDLVYDGTDMVWVNKGQATTPANASESVAGIVELATVEEATTGTDTARAVTPAGVAAVVAALPSGTPSGAVMQYAGATEPSGWLFCYGQAISRAIYAALFTAIGTTYGTGDGSTTFNIPDIRGRVVAGQDDMGGTSANRLTGLSGGVDGDVLGATGGAETHTLTTAEMPAHTHSYSLPNAATPATNGGTRAAGTTSGTTGSTGGDGAHNNVQPTIILNYIIKT